MSPTTEPVSSRFMAVGRFIDTHVTSHCIKRTGYAGEKGRGRIEEGSRKEREKIVALSEEERKRERERK